MTTASDYVSALPSPLRPIAEQVCSLIDDTLPEATGDTLALLTAGRVLLGDALPMIERRGITLIGITFSNLFSDDAVQMALPFDGDSSAAIDWTLDGIRDRFGSKAVTRGILLGRSDGLQVPLLPD